MSPLYPVRLPVFEGPLDLLLRLIEREELDITTVALAQVTDQYLAHLAKVECRPVKRLAEFLMVAAKLLLVKSLVLLPHRSMPDSEGEAEGEELVRQLEIYKQFKDMATLLHEREERGLRSYVRLVPLPRRDPQVDLGDVTLSDLLNAAQEALDVMPGPPVGEVVAPITVTLSERIAEIETQVIRHRQIRFRDILSNATTRVEVIVTLLALLELVKQEKVQMRQDQLFGEITIERRSPGAPPLLDTCTTSQPA